VGVRTNIVIDDVLIQEAMKLTGARTKKETVELGLQTLVRLHKQAAIKKLRGKVEWDGDLSKLRETR
jgi:Arc/MetJ family transcription regulator